MAASEFNDSKLVEKKGKFGPRVDPGEDLEVKLGEPSAVVEMQLRSGKFDLFEWVKGDEMGPIIGLEN
jgi:hypothetical protein